MRKNIYELTRMWFSVHLPRVILIHISIFIETVANDVSDISINLPQKMYLRDYEAGVVIKRKNS